MKPTDTELQRQRVRAGEKDIRAIIARDFSASRMNATKWREMAEVLQEIPWVCRFRWIYEPDVSEWMSPWLPYSGSTYFDSNAGPFKTFTIEWMEIDPVEEIKNGLLLKPQRINHAEEIQRRLQEINVPYGWLHTDCRVRSEWLKTMR